MCANMERLKGLKHDTIWLLFHETIKNGIFAYVNQEDEDEDHELECLQRADDQKDEDTRDRTDERSEYRDHIGDADHDGNQR